MSIRTMRVSLVLAFTCLIVPALAHAGWSADPVQVHASSAHIPQVSAADDGHSGAIVVWQEDSATGGALRALHLLATGDVDPLWSAPVNLSTGDVKRDAVGAVPDAAGGAYVWWLEGTSIFLTHVSASGVISTGWSARGRMVGTLIESSHRPTVLPDGGGGVYIAWLSQVFTVPVSTTVRVMRLGPDNTGREGWPLNGRSIGNGMSVPSFIHSFDVATVADGGLWVAFASSIVADTGGLEPGDVRVRRLSVAGLPSPEWPSAGVVVAPFRGDLLANSEYWGPTPAMRLAAVAGDQDGGSFVLFGELLGSGWNLNSEYRLQRLDPQGAVAPGWPPAGIRPRVNYALPANTGAFAETSLRLYQDRRGGVTAGVPAFYDHMTTFMFGRVLESGALAGEDLVVNISRIEVADLPPGGVAAAACIPVDPYGPYSPSAFVGVAQSGGSPSFVEYHNEPVLNWYGDVGLAATQDGGAIFVWSQERERFGVFAIRLGPAGQVTGVPPVAMGPSLRAHFARGRGVLAQVTLPGALDAELALLDVQGRVESTVRAASNSTLETTFPGTAALSPGVYFVRASGAGQQLTRRVVVLR